MDNASKNAKDMIDRLTMQYNRGRQAAITNELVDIITGKFLYHVYMTHISSLSSPLQVPALYRGRRAIRLENATRYRLCRSVATDKQETMPFTPLRRPIFEPWNSIDLPFTPYDLQIQAERL